MKEAIEKARKYAETLEAIGERNKPKPKIKRGVDYEKLVHKVARRLLELYYRPKKKFKPSHNKDVGGLKQAGVTDKEIGKLR